MEIVSISGASCSGKSTLAASLKKHFGNKCQIILIDNYYFQSNLPFDERAMINHDLPTAHDWNLLNEHIKMLKHGFSVESPVYSYREHNRTADTITIYPVEVLIIEGIHALHKPGILKHLTIKVFLDSSPNERKQRRIKRDLSERSGDIEHVLTKFCTQTEPTFKQFESLLKSQADIVTDDLLLAESQIISLTKRKNRP